MLQNNNRNDYADNVIGEIVLVILNNKEVQL